MVTTVKQVAIIGPTASGKSELAMQVAKQCQGEIICADSRTIYRGMDIGTAKPTIDDQAKVPHHCLDLLEPSQPYSAGQFKRDASEAIGSIKSRRKTPVIAGGSGLYVYGLVYDYRFPAGADNTLRHQLDQLSLSELQDRLKQLDEQTYSEIDTNNPRRLIRAIETAGKPKLKNQKLPSDTLLIGVFPGFTELTQRINKRTEAMIRAGLVDEVGKLIDKHSSKAEPLQTIGYKEVAGYLDGKTSLDQMSELISLHTFQLAKRQMTWFKRNKEILWFDTTNQALEYIVKNLPVHTHK